MQRVGAACGPQGGELETGINHTSASHTESSEM